MAEDIADVISPPVAGSSTPGDQDEVVVTVMNLLTERSRHLKIVSIVGMPGLGKTTLAKKVYEQSYIADYFYVRAWIRVSQVYKKRELLLQILSSPHTQPSSDIDKMSDEKLMEHVYKRLKGLRYLIVMDDMWSTGAWDDLKNCFPNDAVGSRIMFTSRNRNVALQVGSILYDLCPLSEEKSWVLLREKVFQNEICPPELVELGKKIAKNCQGLPLSIVVLGGLLAKTEKIEHWWKQVVGSSVSYVSDSMQCMRLIELSYNYLPKQLKKLFLYVGVFPEDFEIPFSILVWLWMAEGFIENDEKKNLEDVAEDYLHDLIERNLIVISKTRSNGGVKSCRIHDLLRDLCLRKAEETNFLQQLDGYEQVSSKISSPSSSSSSSPSTSPPSSPIANKLCRFVIRSGFLGNLPYNCSQVCALLCFESLSSRFTSIFYQDFELLRVLVLWHVVSDSFPSEIEQLVHLRYLALRVRFNELPPSLSNLQNLETLIVKGLVGSIVVCADIYRMTKLRHLCINPSASLRLDDSLLLVDLQTISTQYFGHFNWSYLKSSPNLRKLRCIISHYEHDRSVRKSEFLLKLEKLKMYYNGMARGIYLFDLLPSLKQITLSNFRFHWREILKLARLQNLEVLKLLTNAFDGDWLDDTSFEESSFIPFPKLKFLKFESLNIRQWKIEKDYFPVLQRLVLNRCKQLIEIPFDLGDIPTLQTIELNWYNDLAAQSAEEIKEWQQGVGNYTLKIVFNPPYSCASQLSIGD